MRKEAALHSHFPVDFLTISITQYRDSGPQVSLAQGSQSLRDTPADLKYMLSGHIGCRHTDCTRKQELAYR